MSEYINDFGLSNVVIRNLKSNIKQGGFDNEAEINEAVDYLIKELNNSRSDFLCILETYKNCTHEFGNSTYTIRRMLFGYNTVYERKCKHCRYVEAFTNNEDEPEEIIPEWTKGATEQYYNNFI